MKKIFSIFITTFFLGILFIGCSNPVSAENKNQKDSTNLNSDTNENKENLPGGLQKIVRITPNNVTGVAPLTVTFNASIVTVIPTDPPPPYYSYSEEKNSSDTKNQISTTESAYFYWDFGDGSYATGQSITHTFNASGTYTVQCGYKGSVSNPVGSGYATITAITYSLRDRGPAGGWIFYDKGYYSDGWRYLEAAPNDIPGERNWGRGNGERPVPGADGTAIGTGKQNTLDIIVDYPESTFIAAYACDQYSTTNNGITYDDWFLPSKDELNQMYINLKSYGDYGFGWGYYWSSSEFSPAFAWVSYFYGDGGQFYYITYGRCGVRAIRQF